MTSQIPTRTWLAFAGLLSINLMIALDLTILANALPVPLPVSKFVASSVTNIDI